MYDRFERVRAKLQATVANVCVNVWCDYRAIDSGNCYVCENDCESVAVSQGGQKRKTMWLHKRKETRRAKKSDTDFRRSTISLPVEFNNNRRVQLRRTKRCHNGASFKENTGQFARDEKLVLIIL